MALFHWGHAWGEFQDLERQVDRLLQSIRFPFPVIRVERHYPPINLYDLPDHLLLTAEIPGVTPERLEVTFNQGVLMLKGSRQGPDISDDQFRRHERFWGEWQRSIPVNERIREEEVSAELNDGILVVRLPKIDDARTRQIPVTTTATSNGSGLL